MPSTPTSPAPSSPSPAIAASAAAAKLSPAWAGSSTDTAARLKEWSMREMERSKCSRRREQASRLADTSSSLPPPLLWPRRAAGVCVVAYLLCPRRRTCPSKRARGGRSGSSMGTHRSSAKGTRRDASSPSASRERSTRGAVASTTVASRGNIERESSCSSTSPSPTSAARSC
eukprot:scaffold83396_cov28-Tisochrysis_lutea.AAC.2